MTDGREYQMFMAHLPLDQFDELEDRIKLFDTEYIIAHETGKNPHYHFIVKITDKEYHNFCQEIFKKKYQLRGRATKDNPRQYGKERNIKDLDRSIMYTLKDGNFRTNMDETTIRNLYDQSFKKDQKITEITKLFEYLDKKDYTITRYVNDFEEFKYKIDGKSAIRTILLDIYRYCDKNKDVLSISRTSINNYFLKYLRITDNIDIEDKISLQMIFNGHDRF